MDLEVERVLEFLQRKKIRATYQAVGQRLSTPTRSVSGRLGPMCPLASWVVRADTGAPEGYAPTQIHPDLKTNDKIITDSEPTAMRDNGQDFRSTEKARWDSEPYPSYGRTERV